MIALAIATPAASQPAPRTDAAEMAYQEGRRLYDLREWDKAIVKFKESYKLRSDAASLFNIAQSYRQKGDCAEAIGFYRTYKRNFPTAPNIDKVDAFTTELEPCAQQQATASKKEPTAPIGEPTKAGGEPIKPAEPTSPTVVDRGAGKRTAGLVIGGAGVLVVGTGFVFGLLAKSK